MIYENLIVIVLFAPLLAIIAHPVVYGIGVAFSIATIIKGCRIVYRNPSRLLVLSLVFVAIWRTALAALWLLGCPSLFGH